VGEGPRVAAPDTQLVTPSPFGLLLLSGLGCGVLGAATATDMVSLRELAHSVDVPLLSAFVIALREALPTNVAHLLEPATGVVGGLVAACALMRPSHVRADALAWMRGTSQRTVLALGLLRVG
jgi:hypothetical protein